MTAPLADAPRLRVGVVGAGRVGSVLAAAWARAGHRVVAMSVGGAGLDRARALLPGVPVVAPEDVVRAAELVLLAVPGRDLPGLVAGLDAAGSWRPGQLAAHTAPGLGLEVFAPVADRVVGLALHPTMVFTGGAADLAHLREAVVAVSAPPLLDAVAASLVLELGAEPVLVAPADRARYDAALTLATEGVGALAGQVREVLEACGVEEAVRVVGPLLRTAVEAAVGSGAVPTSALAAGPVATRDAERVAAHLAATAGQPEGESYRALARSAAAQADRGHITTPPHLAEVMRVLDLP